MANLVPVDTTQMTYDFDHHVYVLDIEYIKNELGLDFVAKERSLTKAKDKMYQCSRLLYDYIYVHTLNRKRLLEYNLAVQVDLRPVIQEALEWQVRYEYESSVMALTRTVGVNPLNGITLKLNDLRGQRAISLQAENILLYNGLLYTGRYNSIVDESELVYETLGY